MNVSTCYKKSTASKDSVDLWLYLLILSTSSPHSHKNKHFLNCCLRYVGSMKVLNIPDVKHQHQAEKAQVEQNLSAQPVVQEDHLQRSAQIIIIIPTDKFQSTPSLVNKNQKVTTSSYCIFSYHNCQHFTNPIHYTENGHRNYHICSLLCIHTSNLRKTFSNQ